MLACCDDPPRAGPARANDAALQLNAGGAGGSHCKVVICTHTHTHNDMLCRDDYVDMYVLMANLALDYECRLVTHSSLWTSISRWCRLVLPEN